MDNGIDINPVFVIGTGRCGLTPLMHLISYHKAFAWPSQYNDRYPSKYHYSYLSRILDIPVFNNSIKFKGRFPTHSEAYNFWDNLYKGFRRPFRDLEKDDVSIDIKHRFNKAVKSILRYHGKEHFIAEYSGWSRIGFMTEVFPSARFIHIVRDGRAVANSLINTPYWNGWEGIYKWRWGIPDSESLKVLEKYNFSFLALAAIQWKMVVNNIEQKSQFLATNKIITIRYEDLVKSPIQTANRCIDFIGVNSKCPKFIKHISTVKIIDANNKNYRIPAWKNSLTKSQTDMLNNILSNDLIRLGYQI